MTSLNRPLVLDMFIRHETLTLTDASKKENLGMVPEKAHLQVLLDDLEKNGYLQKLQGAAKMTYTITEDGIAAGEHATD